MFGVNQTSLQAGVSYKGEGRGAPILAGLELIPVSIIAIRLYAKSAVSIPAMGHHYQIILLGDSSTWV